MVVRLLRVLDDAVPLVHPFVMGVWAMGRWGVEISHQSSLDVTLSSADVGPLSVSCPPLADMARSVNSPPFHPPVTSLKIVLYLVRGIVDV